MANLDFHWIVPDLAQGGKVSAPKSAFETFDVVAFCAEELQPRIKAPKGKAIFRIPLDDDIYRPIPEEVGEILHESAKALCTYCAGGKKVLTTCQEGRNRSGVMTALILMYGYSMKPDTAIKLIRKKRPVDALANPMFVQFLRTTQLR